MRINRLDLLAYGPFQNKSLSLGPGFHLIHGPNEAGKSTTLRAVTSLLFGFPKGLEDDYLFSSADMALGGEISAADGPPLVFVRRRRGKAALSDCEGIPLDPGRLSRITGGLAREDFERLFSLNHERLRRFAEALLVEGGGLGEGLVEAGAGIVGLRKKIAELDSLRGELFLPRGKTKVINALSARHIELRKEARRLSVSPTEYQRLEKERVRLEAAQSGIRRELASVDREIREGERLLRILPLKARYEFLSEKLSSLSHVPLLPPEAFDRRIRAETDLRSANEELARLEGRLRELALQKESSPVIEAVSRLDGEIAALGPALGAISKSLSERPRREARLAELRGQASMLMERLGWGNDPGTLSSRLPSPACQKKIALLLEKRGALDSRRGLAAETLAKGEKSLALLREEASALAPMPDLPPLEVLTERAIRLSEQAPERKRREKALAAGLQTLAEEVRALRISSGEIGELRAFPAPSEATIAEFEGRFRAHFEREEGLLREREALEKKGRELAGRLRRLRLSGEILSLSEMMELRRLRDRSFDLLRRRHVEGLEGSEPECRALFLDAGEAPGARALYVAGLISEADHAGDAIRAHAKEAAEIDLLRQEEEETSLRKNELLEESAAVGAALSSLAADWVAAWPAGFISSGASGRPDPLPEALASWQKRREALLLQAEGRSSERLLLREMEEAERDLRTEAEAFFLRSGLSTIVASASAASLEELAARLREALETGKALKTRHERNADLLRERVRAAEEAREEVGRLDREGELWKKEFSQALREGGLPLTEEASGVPERLALLQSLTALEKEIAEFSDRIRKMEEDESLFNETVRDLRERSGQKIPGEEILPVATALLDLSKINHENAVRQASHEESIRQAQSEKKRLEESASRNALLLEALLREAGGKDPADLPAIEALSREKEGLRKAQEDLEAHLLSEGMGESLDALLSRAEGVEGEALRARVEERLEKNKELMNALESAVSAYATFTSETSLRLEGGLSADLEQEGETVLATLAENVEEYLRKTVMEAVLRRGVDLYRERTQGPLLARGSELFSTMTAGRYRGLRADFGQKGEPVLRAERDNGTSLGTEALSDGTLDLLYLSLRLAAVMRHNSIAEPLPFLADDLLVNLDDNRARKAFQALSETAATSQVLFFTHHEHMRDLAREVLPDCRVHELEGNKQE
ncbi:MAG: AAA family ATPase [Leptospirillia bacterium]